MPRGQLPCDADPVPGRALLRRCELGLRPAPAAREGVSWGESVCGKSRNRGTRSPPSVKAQNSRPVLAFSRDAITGPRTVTLRGSAPRLAPRPCRPQGWGQRPGATAWSPRVGMSHGAPVRSLRAGRCQNGALGSTEGSPPGKGGDPSPFGSSRGEGPSCFASAWLPRGHWHGAWKPQTTSLAGRQTERGAGAAVPR